MAGKDLTVRINVDVSEALTGLKAIQREAKKATQALRELEAAQKPFWEGGLVIPASANFTIGYDEDTDGDARDLTGKLREVRD